MELMERLIELGDRLCPPRTHRRMNEGIYKKKDKKRERGKKTGDCLTAGGRSSVLKGLLENPPVVCGNARSGLITDRAGPLVLLHQQRSIYIYIYSIHGYLYDIIGETYRLTPTASFVSDFLFLNSQMRKG